MLAFVSRHGKIGLSLGLLVGLASPTLANALRPYLGELVALQLFLSAFRIGPVAALESLQALGRTVLAIGLMQVVLPVVAILLFGAFGVMGAPLALVIVLLMAAPSASGVPNFTLLLGHDPAPAMRVLILGTALMPLTVLPVFWLLPGIGETSAALIAALRLMGVILGATFGAFALRYWWFKTLRPGTQESLGGATVITLAVLAVALMSAVGPTLQSDPMRLAGWLLAAFAINFGLQIVACWGMNLRGKTHAAVATGIGAGNRNIALFLVALPEAVTEPLLVFIGCYQIPMFLTPVLMGRFYGKVEHAS
jgi:hypothetical protein